MILYICIAYTQHQIHQTRKIKQNKPIIASVVKMFTVREQDFFMTQREWILLKFSQEPGRRNIHINKTTAAAQVQADAHCLSSVSIQMLSDKHFLQSPIRELAIRRTSSSDCGYGKSVAPGRKEKRQILELDEMNYIHFKNIGIIVLKDYGLTIFG